MKTKERFDRAATVPKPKAWRWLSEAHGWVLAGVDRHLVGCEHLCWLLALLVVCVACHRGISNGAGQNLAAGGQMESTQR
jgi:hypothetical protein